jgi:hypothetical protein
VGSYSSVNVILGTARWFSLASIQLRGLGKVTGNSEHMKEYTMRGTYEAYILVKIKDGTHYVCALNCRKKDKNSDKPMGLRQRLAYLSTQVTWN